MRNVVDTIDLTVICKRNVSQSVSLYWEGKHVHAKMQLNLRIFSCRTRAHIYEKKDRSCLSCGIAVFFLTYLCVAFADLHVRKFYPQCISTAA